MSATALYVIVPPMSSEKKFSFVVTFSPGVLPPDTAAVYAEDVFLPQKHWTAKETRSEYQAGHI